MSLIVLAQRSQLQNLVGLGHCYWDMAAMKDICPKVSEVCPTGLTVMPSGAPCTVFNPCANLDASEDDSACAHSNCPPVTIAKPSGNCTP